MSARSTPSPVAASTPSRLPIAILALAVAAFAIGSTEFTIIGLLPDVADGLDVSIPRAGLLVSAYALGVVIGAPLLTAAGTRMRRHHLLIALMGLFTVGNLLSAIAPNYELFFASRVLAALPHGAFFGVASVVAAKLVAPERRNVAIASMFTGLALANVVGVPLGTLLGQQLGWRASFWAIAVLGVVSVVALARLVPPMERGTSLRAEVAAFRNPRVWLALAITVLGFGGLFAVVGYITPLMTDVAGLSEGAVLPVLAVLGLGMVAGTRLVGRVTRGRQLMHVIPVLLAVMAVVLLLFSLLSPHPVLAVILLFLLGTVAFTVATPIQALIMDEAPNAPALVSAANQAGFNLGNALGPALGSVTISAGLGYASVGWVGACITGSGLLLALLFARTAVRPGRDAAAAPGAACASGD